MRKNAYMLRNMRQVLEALTSRTAVRDPRPRLRHGNPRRHDELPVPEPGHGNGAAVKLPGVHTLWMPVIPLQVGLVIKPGSSEPWTPYRVVEAFAQAGVPREAMSLYPGGHDCGPAVMESCAKSMIFGGQATIDNYHGDPRVQAHGPGYSKILLGDDVVDDWEKYLDLMVDSIFLNGGRSCINASGVWPAGTPPRSRTRSPSGSDRSPRCR